MRIDVTVADQVGIAQVQYRARHGNHMPGQACIVAFGPDDNIAASPSRMPSRPGRPGKIAGLAQGRRR
jgi:hypothetical protein